MTNSNSERGVRLETTRARVPRCVQNGPLTAGESPGERGENHRAKREITQCKPVTVLPPMPAVLMQSLNPLFQPPQ